MLVANRGEIAVRIIRACREMGIATVAVYSDADVDAPHVRLADRAIRLGPPAAVDSYLRGDLIVEAALSTGAEAIHPGYGFLAERASFARATEDAGLVFVGPSSTTIELLGDKVAARRTAVAAGIPILPGTLEPFAVDAPDAVEAILVAAERIGYPLLVKAAAGGGGRGMRRVMTADDLPAALIAGADEAAAAFGDGAVYLEREIHPARHIEVQLLGDVEGSVVALGERDCSLQRRHQKLLEEAPAPLLTEAERRDLHETAVKAAMAVGLVNAATAEFLFDTSRRFWFLEINTRLQVEHGVTELVHDIDIVREQLWIAAGYPCSERVLDAAAQAARPKRHAIEVRLSAEDPARGFAPTPGTIGRWDLPHGPGIRVDTAVASASRIVPDYDPLIAKLMVVDESRDAAIDRLARALDETTIGGIQTTLPFHRFIVADPAFRVADLSVDWVDRHWAAIATERRLEALDIAARAAGAAVADVGSGASPTPLVGGSAATGKDIVGGPAVASAWSRVGRARAIDRWPR
ncbi:MAG TPA: biotin carboxylase N-terminal domain-containing protein [Candidatus Limnocylindrales bacterium]|nr:biotin carboxylase N-terminal domain-containing protein [Candidatus Limnocylindrales bacterium]